MLSFLANGLESKNLLLTSIDHASMYSQEDSTLALGKSLDFSKSDATSPNSFCIEGFIGAWMTAISQEKIWIGNPFTAALDIPQKLLQIHQKVFALKALLVFEWQPLPMENSELAALSW